MPTGERDDGCLLCQAERITHWYHEDDLCWIADCTICATPMVVWRWHGVDPSDEDRAAMLARLSATADTVFDGHYYDGNMRNIPDHFHVHARPDGGFFGHGFRRDTSPGRGSTVAGLVPPPGATPAAPAAAPTAPAPTAPAPAAPATPPAAATPAPAAPATPTDPAGTAAPPGPAIRTGSPEEGA